MQGFTLPTLIKKVHIPYFDDHLRDEEAETLVRKSLAQSAVSFMEYLYEKNIPNSFLLQNQQEIWKHQLQIEHCNITPEVRRKYIAVLQHQRETLRKLNQSPRISEEVIRYFENQLDLEEVKWTRKYVS